MRKSRLRAAAGVLALLLTLPAFGLTVSADGGATTEDIDTAPTDETTERADMVEHFLYAEVTLADGTHYTTDDPDISVQSGMSVRKYSVGLSPTGAPEARLCTPLGLRYVTALSIADYEALAANENVKEIRIGTLIAPAETVTRVGALTKEALSDALYADVRATPSAWYGTDGATAYFAGSLWNIKEPNYNLALVGVGYVEVELADGTVYTAYAETDADELLASSVAATSVIALRDKGLNESEQYYLGAFASAFNGEKEMLYKQDFAGLKVLAIGDGLFAQNGTTAADAVWVNLLGREYGWRLSNLGIAGATISYDTERTVDNASMYGLLMNDADYCYGSASYYQAGDPSKDPRDVDLILLEGGSNDYDPTVGAAMGGLAQRDAATFLGGWYLMTEELLKRYPNATVVFITAWNNVDRERSDGVGSVAYTSSVKNLYNRVYKNNARVYLIDAGDPAVSGIQMVNADGTPNTAFQSQYAYDAYHLNDAGMRLAADHLLPLIWDIVVETHNVVRTETEQMRYDLDSLNVLAIGDSLFYGAQNTTGKKVWVNSIGKDCAWNITNLGIGGATISYDPDRTAPNASMYRLLFNDATYKFGSRESAAYYNNGYTLKAKEDVDVIFIEGGSNDYGTKVQAPMGTVDSSDPATFLGAWRLMTEELLCQYPNAIVIFITAWENGNQTRDDGANAVEYTSGVVTLYETLYADNDRVYLIDAGDPDVSGVDMQSYGFRQNYAYDAFHLNDAGMKLMADNMLPLIWDVIVNQAGIR